MLLKRYKNMRSHRSFLAFRASVNASKALPNIMIGRKKSTFPGICPPAGSGGGEFAAFRRPGGPARNLLARALRPEAEVSGGR
jgi:hypothetical protein